MAKSSTFDQMARDVKAKSDSRASKYESLKDGMSKGGLTWSQADAETLKGAVAHVTEDGAAVLLSKTSDGGALVVRIVDDQASTPFYPASTAALMDILTTLATM